MSDLVKHIIHFTRANLSYVLVNEKALAKDEHEAMENAFNELNNQLFMMVHPSVRLGLSNSLSAVSSYISILNHLSYLEFLADKAGLTPRQVDALENVYQSTACAANGTRASLGLKVVKAEEYECDDDDDDDDDNDAPPQSATSMMS